MDLNFQDDFEECDSALEFLSDPFVMMQVTHFPAVLHQWLVAAYGEMLRFQQQISDFHYLPYPDTCEEAVSLLHTAESVKEAILMSFQVLKTLIAIVGTNYCLSPDKVPLKDLQEDLDSILCQLIKVRSEKGQNVIKALKRLCWNGSNKGPFRKPVELCMSCICYDSNLCYRKFWELHFKQHFFLPASMYQPCFGAFGEGCCNCLEISEENKSQLKEFDSILKTKPCYKDVDLTTKMMVQFFDDYLKDRFQPQAKKKSFSAHLVNKEILFLHWKFGKIEGRIIYSK
jgi:hypothetical protein